MKLRIPSKGVLERFRLAYELRGAQEGIDVLARYYRIPKMKIRVDGRGIRKSWLAYYCSGKARFRKRTVRKKIVLHELAHHLISYRDLDMKRVEEERLCDRFADEILRKTRTK